MGYSFKSMALQIGVSDKTIASYAQRYSDIITNPKCPQAFEAYKLIASKRKLDIPFEVIKKELLMFYMEYPIKHRVTPETECDDNPGELKLSSEYLSKLYDRAVESLVDSDDVGTDLIKIMKENVLLDCESIINRYVNKKLLSKIKFG